VGDTLFDLHVMVDWSARSTPTTGTDSVWIAARGIDGDELLENPPTRARAARVLDELIDRSWRGTVPRVLLGIDVGLGYPQGTAAALGLDGTPWSSMWENLTARLVDDDRNANNRFEVAADMNRRAGGGAGPFWGCPAARASDVLTVHRPPPGPLGALRSCEHALTAAGFRPASMWQLAGAGSVGGQSLTAIPVLQRIRRDRRDVEIWPFSTGLRAPREGDGRIWIAEVWPTMFGVDLGLHAVRDAAQVLHVARQLSAEDGAGRLWRWFCPDVGPTDRDVVEAEEGWTLDPPRVG
jgi:precorrin-8X/cobalt-precorrin-8 methylmutase